MRLLIVAGGLAVFYVLLLLLVDLLKWAWGKFFRRIE